MSPTEFDVEVRFSGLCAFVPDDELAKAKKLCVVLVNGAGADVYNRHHKALDKEFLRVHRGIVRIPCTNLSPVVSLPEEPTVFWYLRPKTRISFRTQPTAASEGNLMFDLSPTQESNSSSFGWVASMEKILDAPCEIDPDALSPMPSEKILAQVLFRGGSVATTNLPTTTEWQYKPNLAATLYDQRYFAHGVSVFFRGVTEASMEVTDFETGQRSSIPLTPDAKRTALVEISNMCRDNPLEWEGLPDPAVTDDDVRWYYELLDANSTTTLQKLLDLRRVSLPVPVPGGEGAGPDCSPFSFKAAAFDALAKAEFGEV
jgi:hypothetical protein